MAFELKSPAFVSGEEIPRKYTCEGSDVSPPLVWSGAPAETRTFALIVDDPDAPDPRAPQRTWVHWLVYDIPAEETGLREAVRNELDLPGGALMANNDWGKAAYGGPCPPIGRHRYFFHLFALDVEALDPEAPTKAAVEEAMEAHVLGRAELMGTYISDRARQDEMPVRGMDLDPGEASSPT